MNRTKDRDPAFTTDPGCEQLGRIKNSCDTDIPLQEQIIKTTFMFGDTELHPHIFSCSSIQSVGVILEFTAGYPHEFNAISKSHFGDGSSTDEDRCVVVFEGLLHYLFKEQLNQDVVADVGFASVPQ
ncbi:hypothetical protein DPMN_136469 [Dreissena polymorpha]|uniref:Uncharacterized protein n=1 Tax=Dreissena polymorpha TaxID=45954 RepID=A0A9D4G029_DREPO|nr:hypothetical protein DPMN_136469 [Dreissena polymorpha]